jgi:hypothetical protein
MKKIHEKYAVAVGMILLAAGVLLILFFSGFVSDHPELPEGMSPTAAANWLFVSLVFTSWKALPIDNLRWLGRCNLR